MAALEALVGLVIVLVVLFEAFEALVLPRRVVRPFRLTRLYYRTLWPCWTSMAELASPRTRPTLLSIFGPLSLLALFALWAAALISGFALIHDAFGLKHDGFLDALYFSGTTFTTLGYGDVTPATKAGRILAVVEAATGFGFFAIVISYLPVLYQAFSRREAFIALFDARAGSPPAAGRLLLRIPPGADGGACLHAFLAEAERWSAELLEAHLSFPVLGYYRSQHDNQSWLATLTCILDASALLLTIADGDERTQARLTFAMARHTAVDFGLVVNQPPRQPSTDRLPAARLDALLGDLKAAGMAIRNDDASRDKLAELRELYEPFLGALAHYFHFAIPDVLPADDRPDNWQTSAWARRAGPLASLGVDPKDEHFA